MDGVSLFCSRFITALILLGPGWTQNRIALIHHSEQTDFDHYLLPSNWYLH
jgi:hypothetical protein